MPATATRCASACLGAVQPGQMFIRHHAHTMRRLDRWSISDRGQLDIHPATAEYVADGKGFNVLKTVSKEYSYTFHFLLFFFRKRRFRVRVDIFVLFHTVYGGAQEQRIPVRRDKGEIFTFRRHQYDLPLLHREVRRSGAVKSLHRESPAHAAADGERVVLPATDTHSLRERHLVHDELRKGGEPVAGSVDGGETRVIDEIEGVHDTQGRIELLVGNLFSPAAEAEIQRGRLPYLKDFQIAEGGDGHLFRPHPGRGLTRNGILPLTFNLRTDSGNCRP